MDSYQHISLDYVDGTTVIRLKDAELLEREVFIELQEELLKVVHRDRPAVAAVSFEFVKRLSSEMISILLRLRNELAKEGGRVLLCEMRKDIQEIFRVLGLDFPIYATLNEAIDAA